MSLHIATSMDLYHGLEGRRHPSRRSCGHASPDQCCPDPSSQVCWPHGVISSEELAPIFLAPLARPESLATGLSRLIQCVVPALHDEINLVLFIS